MFVLHVGAAQSVGPDELRLMWATACGSLDIDVTRQARGGGDPGRPSYGLWVGETFDRHGAETRMRDLLMARGYLFTLRSTAQ